MVSRVALLLTALAAVAHASFDVKWVTSKSTGILTTEILPPAEYSISLVQKVPRSIVKKNLLTALTKWKGRGRNSGGTNSYTATLEGSDDDEEYITDITIGGQNFKVIVDTGSSDTWLAQRGYKCFNLTSYPEPDSVCAFGSAGFVPSESKTFKADPDKNFNISYGDGEFLTGDAGFDTVTVGGMTVKSQEIGLVTNASWEGDGVSTGLMGLAYPDLTSVFNGTNTSADVFNLTYSNADIYNPLFFTAVKDGVVKNPYFSVALDRGSVAKEINSSIDPHLGYLSFGGIAPVSTTKTAVTVPIEGYAVSSGGTELLFYTVNVSSYNFDGASKLTGSGLQAILDTGTTLNYVPTHIAKEFNSKFIPPAKFVEDQDTYYVACDATAPSFSATIGGVELTVDGKDNILPVGYDAKGNLECISGTQDGGAPEAGNIYILGDTFLHNVVATFNIKTNVVTLTQRTLY